ncbi:MAG: MarR family transcriptional regulator [Brevibacillus sp.]|nr:MarR family transcriptional regulator [Brevibacillus sp.]
MNVYYLGCWVSILHRYGHNYISSQLKQYGIEKGEYLYLFALYDNEGIIQDDLARQLNVDKGSTAKALDKLEKKGLVVRTSNRDRRSNNIFLTEKAHSLKPRIVAVISEWTEVLSSGMTEQQRETAFALFQKMFENAVSFSQKEK